ncbi:20200_t:CDS:2 [Dentiscutata erythropus]|uniref:20200_t:CDS:1 n=1 Tax=Dentiscutata erythropus TaxID=1348616 RepID=A0A9N9D691_9GLOM|nr:20200_t:CDS:2 [Dentiscutata erythropus]
MSVAFDLPNAITLDKHGAKTVSIRTTGHKKSNFTMILDCLANSTKLLAMCIFKLKNMPINNFLKLAQNMYRCKHSLLVLDSFKGHITNLAKKNYSENISKLQLLDVIINYSFKAKLRNFCCGISSGQDFNIDQQYEIENKDYIELEDNIELIDLTNKETVWVEMKDIDNIYSEEPMVENDWVLVS